MNDIPFSVIIKEYTGVDSVKIEFYWTSPAFHRIFCFNYNVSHISRKGCYNHIESIIVRIIRNSWSIYALTNTSIMRIKFGNII
ncbi:hypothetical protein D3C87_1968340 [compost metagenome]